MHTVELYRKVRLACRDGMSERAAALPRTGAPSSRSGATCARGSPATTRASPPMVVAHFWEGGSWPMASGSIRLLGNFG